MVAPLVSRRAVLRAIRSVAQISHWTSHPITLSLISRPLRGTLVLYWGIMPSPEGSGGLPSQPEQPGDPSKEQGEQEQQPYYMAARYRSEPPARRAYFKAQELIFREERADLSTYRFQLEQVNHVAVVGEQPPQDVEQKLGAILSQGELAYLLPEVVKALYERRTQMKQRGSWVEGHYRPGKKLDY